MQKHKFNTGDIVRLKPEAKNWVAGARNKNHVYGEDLIYEMGQTVKYCVDNYTTDFELVSSGMPQPELKTKPHKHAELIKKWADGAKIELLSLDGKTWIDDPYPDWHLHNLYREAKGREFPKTSLRYSDLYEEYKLGTSGIDQIIRVANLAIKQYILDTENAKTI